MQTDTTCSLPAAFVPPAALTGLPESTPMLVAYSGGADSTALLHMAVAYGSVTGARIFAAHVNHGIRGAEADADEAFCRKTAASLGVELFVCRADVPGEAARTGESIETAARRIRYGFFDEVMAKERIPLLVTAHNADDNLETMLHHMIRGSGLGGICGIPACRSCKEGTLVRPILSMTKEDILAYCASHALPFVTDSTNTDTDYTRNKLRAQVLPALRQINSAAVENAARLAQTLRADALCLESMTDLFLEGFRRGFSVETEKLCGSPDAIVSRALRRLYSELSEGHVLESAHVAALMNLARKAVPHSSVRLPHGYEGVIENRLLVLRPAQARLSIESYSVPLTEGTNKISQTNCEIVITPSQNAKNIYKNSILLSLDSATINGALIARRREAGDRILLGGMHKSLKKLMCDKKIPPALRDRLPVICDENGILAVPMIGTRDGATRSPEETGAICLHFYLY
ncbi:MAG: tRNA lysidine(34) synthetase TilS [Clostridia bacterium]|nr:tRNA lysidine(34) synthetase TilS [Clostridia bacterium]